jgi:transposase
LYVAVHHTLEGLQELTRAQQGRRAWKRYQAVVLARQGDTAEQIARALDCGARTAQTWVAKYNAGGAAALGERPRPGRPTTLPRDQEDRLRARLDARPRPEDGTCALHGPDVRRILEEEFAAEYTLQGVYDLLHRLGYSSLMPRPQHRDAGPAAQEAFRQGPPRRSKPPPRPAPANGCRSGSRTRRGSGSRGR